MACAVGIRRAGHVLDCWEALRMKFINTDGSAIIGPGSEWFWTAASGVVLAVTFLAIYRQLRLQASAMARQQLSDINEEWNGERMARKRLVVYHALLSETHLDSDTPIVWDTCNFWEYVGGLARGGHMDMKLMRTTLAPIITWWWAVMGPAVKTAQLEYEAPELFCDFEWLAAEMLKLGSALPTQNSRPVTPEDLRAAIARTEQAVAIEESVRAVRFTQ
jgi:hypothetical protein